MRAELIHDSTRNAKSMLLPWGCVDVRQSAFNTDLMSRDPTETNPDLYRVVFENERVRVLEYQDVPGDRTTPHVHPDSVMVTLSDFDRS